MITANSVEFLSDNIKNILAREIPRQDVSFNLETCARDYKKIVFLKGGAEIGALLYIVSENIFFISVMAIDAQAAPMVGNDCYLWVENEAKKIGCEYIQFESPRRAMLRHSIKYGWSIVNVKYQKKL